MTYLAIHCNPKQFQKCIKKEFFLTNAEGRHFISILFYPIPVIYVFNF